MTRLLFVLLAISTLVLVGRRESRSVSTTPHQRFQYTGHYSFTTEVEEAGETCQRWQPQWPMVGAFYVENKTDSAVHIREEALGCALTLTTEGKQNTATDVECEWVGPVNAQALGVTKRTYSMFEIDFETGSIAAEGQFERTLRDSTVMITCFKFSGKLETD